jgi:eukaryotic-like serine/threonine-protein kinase
MRSDSDLAKTIEWQARTLVSLAATIERDPRATVKPETLAVDSAGSRALDVLRALGHDAAARLEIERTLGEGGMAVVHLATQVSLGRKVAVKTLYPDTRDDASTLRLVREAWVTGALEHPNVVPVYDIDVDPGGSPVIVLKRIEGVHWGELMHDAPRIEASFGARDALRWNLEVLMQVCNAAHFAHSRGIVHRDLKPENVMIGGFGEVYVLDWGIAVSLRDDAEGRLARARDAKEMAGTPAYMAPEMLGAEVGSLSERTDVYLLGAILYEIVAGRPPHTGADLVEIVSSVVISEPAMPDHVPRELARVCRRAVSRDPADRFASAAELREALSDFLHHSGSERLAAEADQRLERLAELLQTPVSDDAYRQQIYNLLGQCRFGFKAALAEWNANGAARAGLVRATTLMAEHELAHGDARAAASLLAEFDDAPRELSERVSAALWARAEEERHIGELKELERSLDPGIGSRTRTFVTIVLGVSWTVIPLVIDWKWRQAVLSSQKVFFGASLGLLVTASGLVFWARESLGKTLVNRRAAATLLFVLVAQLVLQGGCVLARMNVAETHTLMFFLWFTSAALLSILLTSELWPTALGYLAGFFLATRFPNQVLRLTSLANLILTANIAAVWGRSLVGFRTPPESRAR